MTLTATDALIPVFTVGCFTCPYIVRQTSPRAAHDAMERHYSDQHAALISRLVGEVVCR